MAPEAGEKSRGMQGCDLRKPLWPLVTRGLNEKLKPQVEIYFLVSSLVP